MSIFQLDLDGVHATVDDHTGDVFDSNHNLIGHYDAHSHQVLDANGTTVMSIDLEHHQLFDQNHNLMASMHQDGTIQTVTDSIGNLLGGYDTNTSQILDSAFNTLGQLKKLW